MATRTASKKLATVSLAEDRFTSSTPFKVDREKGIIFGVKILGEQSANPPPRNNTYARATREAAIPVLENSRVFVDHPAPNEVGKPRSYASANGRIKNIHENGDGLYADYHFNPEHALSKQLLWDAEHSPDCVGFSINADGRCRSEGGRNLVEEITNVRSIDLVARPATAKSLYEGHEPMNTKTLSEVRESLAKDSKERGFLQLLEDDGMLPPDTAMPADAAGDDPVEAAFKAAMNGFTDKLYNGSITDEEFLGKMKDLVKMRTKMADMSAKKDAASTDTTPVMAGKVESPSDPGTVKLLERLTYLENKDKARAECKTAKFDPSDSLLEALVLLPEPKRKALIEEQKKLTVPALPRTRSSTLTEGLNGNPKTDDEWLALIL